MVLVGSGAIELVATPGGVSGRPSQMVGVLSARALHDLHRVLSAAARDLKNGLVTAHACKSCDLRVMVVIQEQTL